MKFKTLNTIICSAAILLVFCFLYFYSSFVYLLK